ncbi:MAG: PAS domain S-box protein [Syntrophales bacterium]|jgi:PAS domain S-box-containing protein
MKIGYGLPKHFLIRYGISICITIAALLSYQMLVKLVGSSLPTYITFYPAVILTALLAGFGPGLLGTATAAFLVAYWILPPQGRLAISSFPDAVGLAIFSFSGVLITVTAELYRRARERAADDAADLALRDERKKAEEKLENGQRRLSEAMDLAQAANWELDVESRVFTFDDRFYALYGTSAEREGGNRMSAEDYARNFLFPEDVQIVADEIQRAIAEPDHRAAWQLEHRIRRRDGQTRYVSVHISVIKDASGRTVMTRGVNHDITERKRAEEVLRESEERYRYLIQHAPTGIFEADFTARKYLSVNVVMCQYTGYTREEFLSLNPIQLLTEESMEAFIQRHAKVLAGEPVPDDVEFKIKRKDGSEFWVLLHTRYSYEPNNRITATVIAHDITERKRADIELRGAYERLRAAEEQMRAQYNSLVESEQSLRESEERFKTLFEKSTDAQILLDYEGKVVDCNDAHVKLFGLQGKSEILGHTPVDFAPEFQPDGTPSSEIGKKMRTAILEKGSARFEWVHQKHDPARTPIVTELSCTLIRSADNPIIHVAIWDITKRKRAEEALRKSEEKFVKTFQSNPACVGLSRLRDGLIIEANEAMLNILGYSQDEFIGHTIPELGVWNDLIDRERLVQTLMTEGKSMNQEYWFRTKTGELLLCSQSTEIIQIDNEPHIIFTFFDLTESKRIEGERKVLQERLQRAEKMEAIGTLAGGIAHDFNNILGAVLGYTEMALGESKLDSHLRRYLEQIFKAGERARDLVKQILSFSRQSDEKPRPLRVSPIVKEVMRLVRASVPSTINIRQDIHEDWDTVVADSTQIHQILMNLCTNAAYAMRGEKGELKVSLVPVNVEPPDNLIVRHDLSPGKYLRLTVSDTGAGIDNEIMDRIFDPFFTTKKPGEGTGLGLSVVYGIVKSYGGAITVTSEVGKGTGFNVYLPLLTGVEDKEEANVEEPVPRGNERILFVDDEAALVQLATSILSGLGYEVTGRTSSPEALQVFRNRPDSFDLVITDMTMPNMTGSELAQQLMRIRPDIPVILCTGFSEEVTQEKARAIGVREFIMKPIVRRQIAEAIRRALDKKE